MYIVSCVQARENLGPALMNLDNYIHRSYKSTSWPTIMPNTHLEMNDRIDTLTSTLTNIITLNSDKLTEAETNYFKRSLKSHFRLLIFYGLPKVHKTPMSLKPVVRSTSSLLAVFSTWLDIKMKKLLSTKQRPNYHSQRKNQCVLTLIQLPALHPSETSCILTKRYYLTTSL